MDTKFCPQCQITKPVSEFYLNKARTDGLSGYCVECQKAVAKASKRRKRLELIDLLGGCCVECGFSDPRALHIDHINGDGAIDRITFPNSTTERFYKQVRANPDRYALLCANCNWIKRVEQEEGHRGRVYQRIAPQRRLQGEGRHSKAANARRAASSKATWASPELRQQKAEQMRVRATGRKLEVGSDGKRHWVYPA